MGFIFRKLVESDRQDIKKLFNMYHGILDIPFTEIIDRFIALEHSYACCKDGKFVGMGGIEYTKRMNEYRYRHVALLPEYKDSGVGAVFYAFLLSKVNYKKKTLLGEIQIPVVAYAIEGADNNRFISNISKKDYTVITKKTKVIRRYIVDVERLEKVNAIVQSRKQKSVQ